VEALEDDMRRLAEWPALTVVVLCIAWILISMFVPWVWMDIQMRRQLAIVERTGGVEGMSVQVDAVTVLLPPLAFCVAWFIARRRARRAVARRQV
jgi:hypothetical protein